MRSRHIALAPSPQQHTIADNKLATPPAPSPVQPLFFHSTTTETSTTTTSSTSSSSSSSSSSSAQPPPPSKFPVQFSPPLIAMVIIIATAFFIITYSRLISRYFLLFHRRYLRWSSRRHDYIPSTSTSNFGSPTFPFDFNSSDFHAYSPGGLGDSAIKSIPLSIYSRKSSSHNCSICLLEFKEKDEVRTLPICKHNFHVECVDKWLRSHVNCPLCRSSILRPESPFVPVMSTRIRPNLDDLIVSSPIIELSTHTTPKSDSITENNGEITITQEQSPSPLRQDEIPGEGRVNNVEIRDFLLKRSYSFGYERNLGSERLAVVEPVTASPWRYRRGMGSFWNKRNSPFNTLMKPRVFSFRSYRGINMKSPFFRRRGDGVGSGFFPLSESSTRFDGSASAGGGFSSSRSYRSFASPMFIRSSATATATAAGSGNFYTSSRLRTGDPEALLSPVRYSNRRMSR